jgi:hypothetical protein
MSAAKKLELNSEVKKKMDELWFITVKEISQRTTYDETYVRKLIGNGTLRSKSLSKGKRVVYLSSFIEFCEKEGLTV